VAKLTVSTIHAYLVHPGKNVEQLHPVGGSCLPHEGKLFALLDGVYHASDDERDIDVSFRPLDDGSQFNLCRKLILDHCSTKTNETGALIAERLQKCTDNRSGMGLLFLLTGNLGLEAQFIMTRFPAESAILAELKDDQLSVEFLERVFVKRAHAYKALRLKHHTPASNFWTGKITDRQVGSLPAQISNYWMTDFLNAELLTTPKAGTMRLADALVGIVKTIHNVSVQSEIASAVSLASGALDGKVTSIDGFCDQFGLSTSVREAFAARVTNADLRSQQFEFHGGEFSNRIKYRSVTLDNGAILSSIARDFDQTFEVQEMPDGRSRYVTIGHKRDERLLARA
jgi:hypothetical protein